MGQLYRWVEKETGKIVYVGMVVGNELADIYLRTQSERSNCLWARKTEYVIQYLSGKLLGRPDFNKNETRTLETHFINLYQTGKNGYNRNHQITGGCLDYVPKEYETAWADLPVAAVLDIEDILNPPFDKMKLNKVKLFFINNGESLREAEETILYALHETLYGPTDPTGKIVVYNNDYLGAIEGITYNGNYYRFLISGLRETDTLRLRAFRGIPFEQNTFHWTGYLCKNIPSKAIACEPYLNELWGKVMKAKDILEKYCPKLISNRKAHVFQKVYEGVKQSRYGVITEMYRELHNKMISQDENTGSEEEL